MAEPLLIVLDEPCAGLDPAAREDFLSLLDRQLINPNGPTLLLVTHHVEEILPGVNSTLIMQRGEIAVQGKTDTVVTPEAIASAYGSPVPELIERKGRFWPVW